MGTCCCYANEGMTSSLFMSDSEWEIARTMGNFDYVVIGSSFCAIGFVSQVLKNTPNAKIMIIERGDHEDSNNYSPFDRKSKEKESRTYDWAISEDTINGEYIKKVCGMNNVLGGRSLFWKGWSPEPTNEDLQEWPEELIRKVLKYFPHAKKLLNVQPVNEIMEKNGGNGCFGSLQSILHQALESTPTDIEAIKKIKHAPLAVVPVQNCRYGDYQKYSTVQQLMDILKTNKKVKAILKCEVKRIQHENEKAKILETTKGNFILGSAKLILAMSTLPSTTLILNSFQPPCSLSSIGKRFTAHFTTNIYARIPYTTSMSSDLNAAAIYVGGQNETFHIQLTAVFVKGPKPNNDYETMRNLLKTPSEKQLQSCNDHIVFTCACLGQIDHKNEKNWVRLNHEEDITRNITVQIVTNNKDNDLWDTMDNSSFKMLEILANTLLPPAATAGQTKIEYWNSVDERWQSNRPTPKQIRSENVVHPASTMWIGNTDSAPVNPDYQFRGVDNVYLTGGSLWPTGASWNPTCAMTAMAMNLGDNLSQRTLGKL